ncbi:MAG TPA: DUF4337 domain-containing protein [Caulobacteraceae bacterium]|jgi:hypothetical protein|nr:DUF4337 domain-containing protein [Caulobacteraceae bacterium]
MSDSPLEEVEAHEAAERAEEAAEEHKKDSFNSHVTLTIAVLAVVAAIGGSLETTEGDKTIVAKNDAVLQQNQATDTWNEYEAKSVKKNIYAIAADQPGPRQAAYAKVVAQNGADQKVLAEKAKKFEEVRHQYSEVAELHERRHGRLTIGSTLLHMAIAIATLSIILHRRWPWLSAIAISAVGVGIAVWAYL